MAFYEGDNNDSKRYCPFTPIHETCIAHFVFMLYPCHKGCYKLCVQVARHNLGIILIDLFICTSIIHYTIITLQTYPEVFEI